jgi:hypothetical protein
MKQYIKFNWAKEFNDTMVILWDYLNNYDNFYILDFKLCHYNYSPIPNSRRKDDTSVHEKKWVYSNLIKITTDKQ